MLNVTNLHGASTRPVSFSLDRGECLAVQGASGAGKTILLRAIADLDPAQGDVTLHGRSRLDFTGPQWRRMVGYVPAEAGWWADSVGQHFTPNDALYADMAHLNLDRALLSKPVVQASTGERSRLALARALALNPVVLLLDEPTSALDHLNSLAVESLIAQRLQQGVSVVWVTHDPAQAARIAQRRLHIQALSPAIGTEARP